MVAVPAPAFPQPGIISGTPPDPHHQSVFIKGILNQKFAVLAELGNPLMSSFEQIQNEATRIERVMAESRLLFSTLSGKPGIEQQLLFSTVMPFLDVTDVENTPLSIPGFSSMYVTSLGATTPLSIIGTGKGNTDFFRAFNAIADHGLEVWNEGDWSSLSLRVSWTSMMLELDEDYFKGVLERFKIDLRKIEVLRLVTDLKMRVPSKTQSQILRSALLVEYRNVLLTWPEPPPVIMDLYVDKVLFVDSVYPTLYLNHPNTDPEHGINILPSSNDCPQLLSNRPS